MKITPSYLDGALLAINALHGVPAVLDSHRCVLERTWVFDALHDWSGQVGASGPFARDRRIFAPNWCRSSLVTGTEELLESFLYLVVERFPKQPILFLRGTLSMLVATDMEGLIAANESEVSNPLICVDREIEDEDWIDGFRRTHDAFFRHLSAEGGSETPHLAGHCLFRREGDEQGNVDELLRLFAACGLPMPVWPFNGRPQTFGPMAPSAPRIQFPFSACGGTLAADALFVPVDLPVGVQRTTDMLLRLAEAFGLPGRAERVIAEETRLVRDRLGPFVASGLSGRGAVVVADPWTGPALADALSELGVGTALMIVLRRADAPDLDPAAFAGRALRVMVDPDRLEALDELRSLSSSGLADVVIGSALLRDEAELAHLPYVEVSAPGRLQHFSMSSPYMGFEGAVHLAERICGAILEGEHRRRCHGR